MDNRKFAETCLAWEDLQRKADALRAEIEAHVMALRKSQSVGNVVCKFRKGTTRYDYEALARSADDGTQRWPAAVLDATRHTIDWKKACELLGVKDALVKSIGEDSVRVELVESDDASDDLPAMAIDNDIPF